MIDCKLFVLVRNTWNYIAKKETVTGNIIIDCELFVFFKKYLKLHCYVPTYNYHKKETVTGNIIIDCELFVFFLDILKTT